MPEFPSFNLAEMEGLFDIENFSFYFNYPPPENFRKVLRISMNNKYKDTFIDSTKSKKIFKKHFYA